jgi:BirA family biotin operon repressor/biotin-[acetyl-CoA-carboxylase] ligase
MATCGVYWQPERFQQALQTRYLGRVWRYVPELDSTNTALRLWAEEGAPEGALVVADYQRAGRGRLGRSWLASPGRNVLASVLLRPAPVPPGWYALACGLAVAEAIEGQVPGHEVRLKWPNDVWLNGRKVAGVLIESSGACLIAGIGVNVNEEAFPQELAWRATSLYCETGRWIERELLLAALLGRLEFWWEVLTQGQPEALRRAYEARMALLGTWAWIQRLPEQAPQEGLLLGLAPDGALRIRTRADEQISVYAAEVTIGGSGYVAHCGYR